MFRFIVMGASVMSCVSALPAGSQSHSEPMITEQDRNLNSWIWIGGCPQEAQNAAATDHGPFVSSVQVQPQCPSGEGAASAWQDSAAVANGFIASGAGHYSVGAPRYLVIHASARSRFDFTFELPQRQRFTIAGTIAASRQGDFDAPGTFASTTVSLSSGTLITGDLFSVSLNPPFNQPQQQEFAATGFIQPGASRILALAWMFADQAFDNLWVEVDASFDIQVIFTDPADLDLDGVVNVVDLLSLLEQWGQCAAPPAACAADIAPLPAGDGMVNVQDLLMLLNSWN